MTAETFATRVAEALDAMGKTAADLARYVGVSDSAIGYWLDGTTSPRRIRSDNLRKAAEFLDRSISYLIDGTGPVHANDVAEPAPNYAFSRSRSKRLVPVIGTVQAGKWSDANDPYPRGQGHDELEVDGRLAAKLSPVAFFLEIEGDSMLNLQSADCFFPGDLVLIDPRVQPRPGDFVVAKVESVEAATFKQYRDRGRDSSGNPVIDLMPMNANYPTLRIDSANPGSIVGTMVEYRRRRRP